MTEVRIVTVWAGFAAIAEGSVSMASGREAGLAVVDVLRSSQP